MNNRGWNPSADGWNPWHERVPHNTSEPRRGDRSLREILFIDLYTILRQELPVFIIKR
jgi:hypothetical protein